jgi:hypothetical protein
VSRRVLRGAAAVEKAQSPNIAEATSSLVGLILEPIAKLATVLAVEAAELLRISGRPNT